MKISIYTTIKNGLHYDYHIVAMLKHHLALADEIVVNEGYSKDGTYEAIKNIDSRIRIFRNKWVPFNTYTDYSAIKNVARRKCTGDWCILLDMDEFIPEWEFERLRATLEKIDKLILPLKFLHFYGNYKIRLDLRNRKMPPFLNWRIHRNLGSIEVWGDGANVRVKEMPLEKPLEKDAFECYHFSEVRNSARLREKWFFQAKRHKLKPRWAWAPRFLFNLFPHKWADPAILKDLVTYEGPYIKAVRDNPEEFVRDNFYLYNLIKKKTQSES